MGLFEGLSLAANKIISPLRFVSSFSLNLSFVSCVGVIIICLPSLYQSLLSSVSHIACNFQLIFHTFLVKLYQLLFALVVKNTLGLLQFIHFKVHFPNISCCGIATSPC